MSTGLEWKPARLLDVGDVIVGDGGRFKVIEWDPVMPCSRIAMTLVDLAAGSEFEYWARWDDEYAVAPRKVGVAG